MLSQRAFAEGLAVRWVEEHDAVTGPAVLAEVGGVAVSDAHTIMEVAVSYAVLEGDPSTPAGLLAALPPIDLITSRASYLVRTVTPVAKLVQRLRGNGRQRPLQPGPEVDR